MSAIPVCGVVLLRCIVLGLSVLVAGCGFQLRGAVSLPPGVDAIRVAGPPEIGAVLAQMLESRGAEVPATSRPTAAVVHLDDERFSRRVLSVDPDTGKAIEFELAYRVTFRVTGPGGEELVPGQSVSLLRDYVFDPATLLGKNREQETLHAEMRRDAAAQVVRRIAASLGR